jgi:hypothetical protein
MSTPASLSKCVVCARSVGPLHLTYVVPPSEAKLVPNSVKGRSECLLFCPSCQAALFQARRLVMPPPTTWTGEDRIQFWRDDLYHHFPDIDIPMRFKWPRNVIVRHPRE